MATIVIAGEPGEPLDVLEAELAGLGHDVIVALSGQDAYQAVLDKKPDVVMLAARIPVFDGLTTSAMLRNDPDVTKDLPVVIVTSTDLDPKTVERAGVTDVLPTRHEADELREILARHLGKALWL